MIRLLIIDDSKVARIAISSYFSQIDPNIQIYEAGNGTEALELVQTHDFDGITIDYNMPELNGLEVAKKIFEIKKTPKLFILTANIQNAIKEKVEQSGFYFFTKPVTKDLIQAIYSEIKK
ncbi:MAG: response regulator [Leptospiraceae bacterium]|nr:response regulator [Leptospiraceae bacterium]